LARGSVEVSEVEVSALAINATIPELVAMVNAAADLAGTLWGGHRGLS